VKNHPKKQYSILEIVEMPRKGVQSNSEPTKELGDPESTKK